MLLTRYEDVDHFARALRAADGRYLQTSRSEAPWWVAGSEFGRINIQEVHIGAASVYVGVAPAKSFSICLPISLQGAARIEGHAIHPEGFVAIGGGRSTAAAVGGPNSWFALTVSITDSLDEDVQALFNCASASNGKSAGVPSKPAANLRGMARKLLTFESSMTPAIRDSAERELMDLLLKLSQTRDDPHVIHGRQRFNRTRIIARSFEYLGSQEGQSVLLADLCSNAGVTDRTLRNAFYDYFGISPIRLLKLRQLHEINRKLLSAAHQGDTVSSIASRFGVWDFAQFARQYRSIFLERPSDTLRRKVDSSGHPPQGFDEPWISYALKCLRDRA